MNIERKIESIAPGSDFALPKRRFVKVSDLREVLYVLARRKWIIIGAVAIAFLVASTYLYFAQRQYTADLQILFDGDARPMFDLKDVVADQARSEAEIFNQIVVIQSRGLAKRVIDKLGLDQNPEFNTQLRPRGLVDRLLEDYLPTGLVAARSRTDNTERVIDKFQQRLDTRNIPRSRALEVTFTSANPETAAKVLNALADAYVESKLDYKFENVKRGSTWLAERIQMLRANVEKSEKAIEDYRNRNSLFQTEGSTLLAQQISDLNNKLTDARIERSTAEANYAEARRLLNTPDNLGATAVQVLQSDLIRRFREQELELERKAAEMHEQYGASHPAMIQLQAQREELRKKLRDEIRRIFQSLENQVRIAQMRETSLSNDLEGMKKREEVANQALVGLRTLERNAEANRLILQRMMTSFLEATTRNDLESQVPDVRVVSPAAIPDRPSAPRPLILLPVVILSAAGLGALLAFAIEQWDTGFRSAEQAELATGVPVLAHVPWAGAVGRGGTGMSKYIRDQRSSAFAEAMRALHMRLALKSQAPVKVLLVISAQADEGKTTLATSLARQQALAGSRTIVVDADFRRSSVAQVVGLQRTPGLSELLVGAVEVDAAIQHDPQSPAHFMVAGGQPVNNFLLASGRLREILERLRISYDLIVIDSAPLSVISDALVIAQIADATIMTVRWGRTPEGVICSVLNQVGRAGVQVDGLVLSMVDYKKLPSHEYGAYKHYAKYYNN